MFSPSLAAGEQRHLETSILYLYAWNLNLVQLQRLRNFVQEAGVDSSRINKSVSTRYTLPTNTATLGVTHIVICVPNVKPMRAGQSNLTFLESTK